MHNSVYNSIFSLFSHLDLWITIVDVYNFHLTTRYGVLCFVHFVYFLKKWDVDECFMRGIHHFYMFFWGEGDFSGRWMRGRWAGFLRLYVGHNVRFGGMAGRVLH